MKSVFFNWRLNLSALENNLLRLVNIFGSGTSQKLSDLSGPEYFLGIKLTWKIQSIIRHIITATFSWNWKKFTL